MKVLVVALLVFAACGTSGSTTQDGGTTCRKSADCSSSGEYCGLTILAPMCAGACQPKFAGTVCQADADCADAGAGMICSGPTNPGPCFCSSGGAQPESLCVLGCSTAADCGTGLSCDASTHRCVAATCTQASDCGSGNFACTNQACAAKACTGDGDCANYCVFNQCVTSLGTCAPAVP